jgi:tetratricopeptide (TPR) repeat protein
MKKPGLFRRLASFALDYDVNQAIKEQKRVNKAFPDSADGAYRLGILFYSQKRIDEAIEAYHHALRLDPSHARAHKNLGEIHVVQERYDLAWRHARLAHQNGDGRLLDMMRRYLPEPETG